VSANALCSTLQSYANVSHDYKKERPQKERENRYISDHGEQRVREFRRGGVVNIVRWYKEVRMKGRFESALLLLDVALHKTTLTK